MPILFEQVACFNRLCYRASRSSAPIVEPNDMRRVPGIGRYTFHLQILCVSDSIGQSKRGFSRRNTCSVLSNVEVDHNANVNSCGVSGTLEFVDIAHVVNDDQCLGCFSHHTNQARDFRFSDHFRCNEQSPNPGPQHHLRLRNGCDANTDRPLC